MQGLTLWTMNPSKDHENYYPGTLCFLHQARCLDECIAFTCQALWIQHIEFFSPVPFNPTHPILLATAWISGPWSLQVHLRLLRLERARKDGPRLKVSLSQRRLPRKRLRMMTNRSWFGRMHLMLNFAIRWNVLYQHVLIQFHRVRALHHLNFD